MDSVRVVFDANVVVDHIRAEDADCSAAIVNAKKRKHRFVVSEKLMAEYRDVLAGGSAQMHSVVTLLLQRMLPCELMERHEFSGVQIDFGPPEDRHHMQLAIAARARCLVTKDRGVLREANAMARHKVRVIRPKVCAECWE